MTNNISNYGRYLAVDYVAETYDSKPVRKLRNFIVAQQRDFKPLQAGIALAVWMVASLAFISISKMAAATLGGTALYFTVLTAVFLTHSITMFQQRKGPDDIRKFHYNRFCNDIKGEMGSAGTRLSSMMRTVYADFSATVSKVMDRASGYFNR